MPKRRARKGSARSSRPRSPLVRFCLWALVASLAVLFVLGAVAGLRLARIYRDLDRARGLLLAAGDHIENTKLGQARDGLDKAEHLLAGVNRQLYTAPELELIGWLPVVHQNLASLRDSVDLALALADGGHRLLNASVALENDQGKLEVSLVGGVVPVQAMGAAQDESVALAAALPGGSERPRHRFLLPPVADLQDRVFGEAIRRREQLDAVSRALVLLGDMAGANGPRRYLIAVANTAEMRGSGGMILSYGVLESDRGTFKLGPFGSVDELPLDETLDPALLDLPASFVARWAGLEPTRLWRNVNLTPDFKLIAPVMEVMYWKATGTPPDGVIQIDPHGLAALLEGVGPVDVDGLGEVTAQNVVDVTLSEAYARFPNRTARQDVLGDVAEAAFEKLVTGSYTSLRPLGAAVLRATKERHIVFHSPHSEPQTEAGFFLADGALPTAGAVDHAILTVQNFSKNKLDYYVDTGLEVTGKRLPGELGELKATVTVTNTAPDASSPREVFGPNADGEEAGLYRGTVSLYLPAGTSLRGVEGGPTAQKPLTGTEGKRTFVGYTVELAPGESSTLTLTLRLPPRSAGKYQFSLIPQPRVRPTEVALAVDAGDGDEVWHRGPLTKPIVVRTRQAR